MTKVAESEIYNWDRDIAPYLDDIKPVTGGFTPAHRGVIKLSDGTRVFVKIAADDNTTKWLKKEIKVYRVLNGAGYKYIPKLLSANNSETAMAIEYLEGASFDNVWDKQKEEAVIRAQESLKAYKRLFENDSDFKNSDVLDLDPRWSRLLEKGSITKLNTKLKALGSKLKFSKEQIGDYQSRHKGWILKEDCLIHEDIRADNFGYFPEKGEGKLIDWNWLCIGDESLDVTPLFINMYISGFNPYKYHPEKYDKNMLIYLIVFWLTSILDGDQDSSEREWNLRLHQAKSLEACVELLNF